MSSYVKCPIDLFFDLIYNLFEVKSMKKAIISDQVSQDLNEACKIISEKGFEYIDLHNVFGKSIEECNEKEVEEIKTILNKYNLKVSNIASTVFFLCPLYPHYEVSLFNPHFHSIKGDVKHT